MENNTLNAKWDDISAFRDYSGYQALRISSDCIPDLFIALDSDGQRCLLLFLPLGTSVKLRGADKEKLMLTYVQNKNVVIIKLIDLNFIDLFNDLISSLYSKINLISDPDKYANELIQTFYKWVEFFEDSLNSKLSNEELQGLFGELFVLSNAVKKSDSAKINDILDSWKGPYDVTNDFVFDDKNIEVKTIKESKTDVKISSEFQLENEFDKGLELLVIMVVLDLTHGESIYDILTKIILETRKKFGDLSILYQALNQKGLTFESTKEYNNHRFKVTKSRSFDCCIGGFPKLSVSNIHPEITRLSYYLRINALGDFLIEEKIY